MSLLSLQVLIILVYGSAKDMLVYVVILLLFSTSIVGNHIYKIVNFNDVDRYHEYEFKMYGPCLRDTNKMDNYTLVRFDKSNARWDFTNAEEARKKINRVCAYVNFRCPVFRARKFLSLVRNKRIGFLGDSLGLQLFEGVVNQLFQYASKFWNGTHFTPKHDKTTNLIYYQEFNVTMYFCIDSYLVFNRSSQGESCALQYYGSSTDYLVIGFGTWYKPKYFDFEPIAYHRDSDYSYNRSYTESQVLLTNAIQSARRYINATNSKTKVIWRLHPHIGRMDELTLLHKVTGLDHSNGNYWSNTSLGAHWVPVYNDIMQTQAALFGDATIDWYSLSNQYIEYFNTVGVSMHVDSIHYCVTGVPRGGALLLQDAVFDIVHRGHRRVGYHHQPI